MHMHPDRLGRLALAALAAAFSLSVLGNAGAYPIDPGGGGSIPPTSGVVVTTPTSSTYANRSRAVWLPDRMVRLVDIDNHRVGFMPDVGICCTADGGTVDLAAITGINAGAQLAVDAGGRLSLVWSQYNTVYSASEQVRIVGLDSGTLQPNGPVQTVPGLTWSTIEAIACGDTCHLVVEGQATGARKSGYFFWAPGDSLATTLRLPGVKASKPTRVLDARDEAGHLVVTYSIGKATRVLVLPQW
jgi:hypothetical protein